MIEIIMVTTRVGGDECLWQTNIFLFSVHWFPCWVQRLGAVSLSLTHHATDVESYISCALFIHFSNASQLLDSKVPFVVDGNWTLCLLPSLGKHTTAVLYNKFIYRYICSDLRDRHLVADIGGRCLAGFTYQRTLLFFQLVHGILAWWSQTSERKCKSVEYRWCLQHIRKLINSVAQAKNVKLKCYGVNPYPKKRNPNDSKRLCYFTHNYVFAIH